LKIRSRRAGVVLQDKEDEQKSKRIERVDHGHLTYGSEKDQSLLEVTQVCDLPVADSTRDLSNETVEILEFGLVEDRLDDVSVDLLDGVLT